VSISGMRPTCHLADGTRFDRSSVADRWQPPSSYKPAIRIAILLNFPGTTAYCTSLLSGLTNLIAFLQARIQALGRCKPGLRIHAAPDFSADQRASDPAYYRADRVAVAVRNRGWARRLLNRFPTGAVCRRATGYCTPRRVNHGNRLRYSSATLIPIAARLTMPGSFAFSFFLVVAIPVFLFIFALFMLMST
jgi:hypothetical protein